MINIRAVWTAPGNDVIQGNSNVLISRMMNTLKRELQNQQDQLLIDHQDETIVDGGAALSIQFHYLIAPDATPLAAGVGVSNKALTSNVATLTTPTAHGFAVGQSVYVSNVDTTFNGTYTIASVPSSTTFTYQKVAANVTSAAATGSCVVAVGAFDASQGAAGTTPAEYVLDQRRDIIKRRGF